MLIDCEASGNEENSFSKIVDKINNGIYIFSTSGAKIKNILNLTPNLLNEEDSYSLDIPFKEPIGSMQLQKSQIFLKNK